MKDGNAVLGGKTARACDSCIRRRARWFCAADDAFLCHHCDNLVHSANPLATRHDRIRLQASSSKPISSSWFAGFTRKPRTPRHHGTKNVSVLFLNTLPLVPDLGYEEHPRLLDHTTEDHQLFGRVPVFDPFDHMVLDTTVSKDDEIAGSAHLDDFSEFLPSDVDLAEFAADVESLLGKGADEESPEMKGLELFDCQQKQEEEGRSGMVVKVKGETVDTAVDIRAGDVLINWKGESYEDENDMDSVRSESKIFLRLNYEDVISAWDNQGCSWTTGHSPLFSSHQYHCLGWSGGNYVECSKGEAGSLRGHVVDGEREARVSRYREKRRTRLFAKKIRYQVRKLNAEKRPRMKGRFVKRT